MILLPANRRAPAELKVHLVSEKPLNSLQAFTKLLHVHDKHENGFLRRQLAFSRTAAHREREGRQLSSLRVRRTCIITLQHHHKHHEVDTTAAHPGGECARVPPGRCAPSRPVWLVSGYIPHASAGHAWSRGAQMRGDTARRMRDATHGWIWHRHQHLARHPARSGKKPEKSRRQIEKEDQWWVCGRQGAAVG